MCVDVGVERSAYAKSSDDVYCDGGVEMVGGTEGATEGAVAGAETVALEVTGIIADLGII